MSKYKIPYTKEMVLSYPQSSATIKWRDNDPFDATITHTSFSRGRSSALLYWYDSARKLIYPMFIKDLSDAMPYIYGGQITGRFQFQKRGENYGLKLLK